MLSSRQVLYSVQLSEVPFCLNIRDKFAQHGTTEQGPQMQANAKEQPGMQSNKMSVGNTSMSPSAISMMEITMADPSSMMEKVIETNKIDEEEVLIKTVTKQRSINKPGHPVQMLEDTKTTKTIKMCGKMKTITTTTTSEITTPTGDVERKSTTKTITKMIKEKKNVT